MMMLLILTSVLGYELKTAVGTSVFIMTFTALTGAASHFAIGGAPDWTVLILFSFTYKKAKKYLYTVQKYQGNINKI